MKTFEYVGGPAQNGATFRDGRELLLHKGNTYTLDENEPFVQKMLLKKDDNGMPAPWLREMEVENSEPEAAEPEATDEPEEFEEEPTPKNKKGRR